MLNLVVIFIILLTDFNDFNNSVITAIFPADEGLDPITDLNVPIPVFNDNVDEADDQFFIAHLVLVNATNRNLINITRAASSCIIVDNDRELLSYHRF